MDQSQIFEPEWEVEDVLVKLHNEGIEAEAVSVTSNLHQKYSNTCVSASLAVSIA